MSNAKGANNKMDEETVKTVAERLVKAGMELYYGGYVKGASGNISMRLPHAEAFLIKPSGASLRDIKADELVLVDFRGVKLSGKAAVSLETPIHAAIYSVRKDVGAVVHTHPLATTVLGIAGYKILPLQVESYMRFPEGVTMVPYAPPGSKMLAETVKQRILECDALVLENHGLITVGKTIEEACRLTEIVEESAKIQCMLMAITGSSKYSEEELASKYSMNRKKSIQGC